MIDLHLKYAYRSIQKYKLFTTLNVVGLAIGLTGFTLAAVYVHHELSYDTRHSQNDDVFQIIQIEQRDNNVTEYGQTSLPLAAMMRTDVTGVKNAVNIAPGSPSWITYDGKRIFEEGHYLTTQEYFAVFDIEFVRGERRNALTTPYSVVLTESSSKKYFGSNSPIGKTLEIDRYGTFTVSAVIKDPLENSTIQFSMLMSQEFDQYLDHVHPNFAARFSLPSSRVVATFIKLNENAQKESIQQSLQNRLEQLYTDKLTYNEHYLLSIRNFHFESGHIRNFISNSSRNGNMSSVILICMAGALILLLSIINYTNLTIAQFSTRSKEFNVRRFTGATKNNLIRQILTESLIVSLVAVPVSIGLLITVFPQYVSITQLNLSLSKTLLINILLFDGLIGLVVGIVSGVYPSFLILSRPITSGQQSAWSSSSNKYFVRNFLLIFQFSIAAISIITVLFMNKQMAYINDKELGFNTTNKLILEINGGGVRNNFNNLKSDLLNHPSIKTVSGWTRAISGYRLPPKISIGFQNNGTKNQIGANFYGCDEDGIKALELNILRGDDFSGKRTLDSVSVLINQTAANLLGVDVIGKKIELESERGGVPVKIIGIVEDFHFRSLHEPIAPVVIGYLYNRIQGFDDILIDLNGTNNSEAIAYIKQVHNQYDENKIETWRYLDEMIGDYYIGVHVDRKIFGAAMLISIVIAALGLIGLVLQMANQKIKEFGIRKVLGADIFNILMIQMNQYTTQIFIALAISIPLTLLFILNWMDQFAFRTSIDFFPFVFGTAALLGIISIIICIVGYRVAARNPIDHIRHE